MTEAKIVKPDGVVNKLNDKLTDKKIDTVIDAVAPAEKTHEAPSIVNSVNSVNVVSAVAATGGTRLRLRREALSMSIEDVASSLKIPPRKIKAIEAEQWDALPTGPYLRGFLRSYARVLRMDGQSLIEEIDDSLMQSRSPDSILRMPQSFDTPLPRPSISSSDWRHGRRLIYLGVGVLVLIGLLLWSGTPSFNELRARLLGQPLVQSVNQPVATVNSPATSTSAAPGIAAAETVVAAPAVATEAASGAASETASTSTAPVVATGNALTFEFHGESWVQVRQSDGKVLMSKLNAANTQANMEGEGPLDLIVGNANQVKLTYRSQAVDLAAATRDNVARLTLP